MNRPFPLLSFFSRLGLWPSIVVLTVIAVGFAHIALLGLALLCGFEHFYNRQALFLMTVAPILVAPPIAYVVMRLIFQLEGARREMETLSQIDPLTGIYNRRCFFELGEMEVAKARRYRLSLSVLLLDLDHFKHVNDSFGHAIGDIVLAEIVQLCRIELRETDVMGRIGGEEFAILLPLTAPENATIVAEKICNIISGHVIATHTGRLKVTASIGVAGLQDTDSLATMLRTADHNLYAAKSSGRNRIST